MTNINIEHIIAKSLSGEISPDEIIILSDWLASNEENKKEYKSIKKYWNSDVSLLTYSDSAEDFDLLLQRIRQDNVRDKKKRFNVKTYAAAIAAAVFAVLVYSFFFENRETNKIHSYSYVAGNSIINCMLPDSTHITLNKNSTLTYTDAYDKDERAVTLVGEAYFDVKRNESKRFVVNADKSKIVVLGTKFSVKNRMEDNMLKTMLFEGSVRFESQEQNITLNPNKQVIFDKTSNEIEIEKFDPDIEIAWTENLIRYKSLTFSQFMKVIEEHYGVNIILPQKELHMAKFSGSIDASMSVEQILDLMKKNIPYKWNKKDDSYIILYI